MKSDYANQIMLCAINILYLYMPYTHKITPFLKKTEELTELAEILI